jgi:beta-mannanase
MGYDLTGSYDEHAEPSGDFSPIPTDTYRARIEEASIEDISKKDNKGRCLKLTWKVETGPHDGRLVWQRLNMWAENMNNLDKVISIANSQFAAIRQAVGKTIVNNTDELLQIPCDIYVTVVESAGYAPQNEVKSVKPAGNPVQQAAQQRAPAAPRQSAPPQQQRAAPAAGNGKAAPWRQTA